MSDDGLHGKPLELPRVALSLVRLSLVGFSLVLVGQMIWLNATSRAQFAVHNVLGVEPRQVLLLAIGAGLALPTLVTVLVLWLRRRRSTMVDALERVSTLSGPLAISFVVPALFLDQVAEAKPLFYLTVLMTFGLAFHKMLELSLAVGPRARTSLLWEHVRASRTARAVPLVAMLFAAAGYALFLGHFAIAHHRLLLTAAADVGIADNVMANLLHGRLFRAPAQFGLAPGSYLSLHAEYGALLFLPVYRLRPGAETLLWLQVVIAALCVIPLYLLVARRLGRTMALWFGTAYLLLAPLHGALLVGFSWLPAVTLFTLTLYYAVESERRWLLVLSLPLVLASSDAGPLNVFALGLFLLVSGSRTRLGLGLGALAAALVAFNVARSLRGVGAVEHPALAGGIGALLENPVYFVLDLARAVKLASILHALAPLCLLPLFELVTWPLFIPGLLFTSAGTEFWPNGHLDYSASLVWVPACLFATLITLHKLRQDPRRRTSYLAWVVTLTITQLSHSFDFGAILRTDGFGGQATATSFQLTSAAQARHEQLLSLVRRIPDSASVATTDSLLSHVSNRPDAYAIGPGLGRPDYILLWSQEISGGKQSLETLFATHQYRLVAGAAGEFYLFARGVAGAETTAALASLGLDSP